MSRQIVLSNNSAAVRAVYDEYAGMLYGYILEVVDDSCLAEQYLISVFNQLPAHLPDVLQPGVNTYNRLQQLTRKVLSAYFENIPACGFTAGDKSFLPSSQNRFLSRMTPEQQFVFCSIHYSGKSISVVAAEIGMNNGEVKKILQQAFAAIRRAGQ